MLTRGRIEREVSAWKRNGEPEGIVGKAHYLELCRLALLGLEREESRARVEAGIEAETHVESSVLADAFGAFPDLEPVPKRDELRARAEKAERERDEERHLADVRGEMLTKTERERDEARAERDALREALELAEVDVALERSWCRICRTECRVAHRGRREHVHAAECVLNIRAHASKEVKP